MLCLLLTMMLCYVLPEGAAAIPDLVRALGDGAEAPPALLTAEATATATTTTTTTTTTTNNTNNNNNNNNNVNNNILTIILK